MGCNEKQPSIRLGELAEYLKGQLCGDPEAWITGVAEIHCARPGQITFLANPRYADYLRTTRASAVIIDSRTEGEPPLPYIRVDDAYFAYRQTVCLLYPEPRRIDPGVHPSAVLAEGVHLGEGVAVGAHVYLGRNVAVGKNTRILPGCVVMDGSSIGEDCLLHPLVVVREGCTIGNRVIIHSGAVIGSDGFGYARYHGAYHKIPQIGTVVIEDDVEIGANATIDRAALGETRIGRGVKLDNLVHLAHNVRVGAHTVMAAQTGISGSVEIGREVVLGGQVGAAGHIKVGDRVVVGAKSGITKDVAEGQTVFGVPARPIMQAKRMEAALRSLPGLIKRIRQLERELAALKAEEKRK